MIDPAFSKMRLTLAFGAMQDAVADYIERLNAAARHRRNRLSWIRSPAS
jgi:hypothetical protein